MQLPETVFYCQLRDLNIIEPGEVELFFPRVRDDPSIAVLRCKKSGVLFLSQNKDISHYTQMSDLQYWKSCSRSEALAATWPDDQRRAWQFKYHIKAKIWADIGTGLGGLLDILSPAAQATYAVEPQKGIRDLLKTKCGYQVFERIEQLPEACDIITLFHVFEHVPDPLGCLKQIHRQLKPGGEIIIEVPHARDILITLYDCNAFKDHTFWSEHLVLHTKDSLKQLLLAAGYADVMVTGYQRYNLANHLHWLSQQGPGGHDRWKYLSSLKLDREYARLLEAINQTDTLIAMAKAD